MYKTKVKPIEIGSKVFDWTVLAYAGEKGTGRNSFWTCQCKCGHIKDVVGSSLRTGKTTQCQHCSGKANGRIALYSKGSQPHLYMIRCGEYIKIGVSADPERRIKDLKSSNPYPLEVLYIGYDEGHDEELWHNIYQHRHHHGEWYKF